MSYIKKWQRIIAIFVLLAAFLPISAIAPVSRTYAAGSYYLELDGKIMGRLGGFEGGNAFADVVIENVGPDYIHQKHISNVKYEDIILTVGSNMDKSFYSWLGDISENKYVRKNGAIIEADYTNSEISRLTFSNALIHQISFPEVNAAGKEVIWMTVKLSPEFTKIETKNKGSKVNEVISKNPQKAWVSSNFRMSINGLDSATSRIMKISPIIIEQKAIENSIGDARDYTLEPAILEFSDISVTIADVHAKPFFDWYEDFVIKGNNDADKEKSGSLEFLSMNRRETLFKLEFSNLGIYKFRPEKNTNEEIRRDAISMYVEKVKFSAGMK